ncbi:alpha/beta hydrolase [Amycolatopsis anabasis]|uniref:alpha/beta hydrolase n=1 Tax=Amycolatopsis anabasis TaxID=1840409 RepID=UPI001FEAD017|nr:alpha/beta fold hydrolase [Amycolatopsis anabasis]
MPATTGTVTIGAVVFALQRRLLYLPARGPVPAAARFLTGGRDVALHTEDGLTLGAWFFPTAATETKAAVLVTPGNAGDRSLRVPLAAALTARGLSVLLLDYRGYGGNPGSPSEDGLAADARAAQDFLRRETDLPLLYFGESLGAAVAAALAAERPPAGVVLRSPFTSLAAIARHHFPFLPVRWLLQDSYLVSEHVSRIRAPLSVVYGASDSVVPPDQSRAVAAAAAAGSGAHTVEVPGADHNDPVLLNGPQLIATITSLAP